MIGKQKYSTRVLLIHSWQVLVQRLDTAKANITAASRNFGWLNWWKNKVYTEYQAMFTGLLIQKITKICNALQHKQF